MFNIKIKSRWLDKHGYIRLGDVDIAERYVGDEDDVEAMLDILKNIGYTDVEVVPIARRKLSKAEIQQIDDEIEIALPDFDKEF